MEASKWKLDERKTYQEKILLGIVVLYAEGNFPWYDNVVPPSALARLMALSRALQRPYIHDLLFLSRKSPGQRPR